MTAKANERFFGFSDWVSFGLTFISALLLYLITLAPDVTLGFSGIFAAGGMYAGIAHPPGYPLSTLWMWLFIKLVPFGNIAWRLAVSSAVAGAAACGIIALMVSRGGAEFLTNRRHEIQLPEDTRQRPMRAACGWAAGTIFGASGAFWQRAVIVDCWTVSILLFCIVLCLLLRWVYQPQRRRYLYAAAFVYGLVLTNSQIQLVFAPAIPFVVWAGDRRVGRDMFLSGFLIFLAGLGSLFAGKIPLLCKDWSTAHRLFGLFVILGVVTTGCSAGLVILTRKLFTEWKAVLSCGLLLSLGLSLYLYVPVASMTNPPMNWGYPRTPQGFAHVLSRGQYEQIHPTEKASVFVRQLGAYGRVSAKEYGWPFMVLALVPVLTLRRRSSRIRGWVLSLVVSFLSLALLMLAILNPSLDRQSLELNTVFFSISYVVMSIHLGYGLTWLGDRTHGARDISPSNQSNRRREPLRSGVSTQAHRG